MYANGHLLVLWTIDCWMKAEQSWSDDRHTNKKTDRDTREKKRKIIPFCRMASFDISITLLWIRMNWKRSIKNCAAKKTMEKIQATRRNTPSNGSKEKKAVVLCFSSFIIGNDSRNNSNDMGYRGYPLDSLNCGSSITTIDNHKYNRMREEKNIKQQHRQRSKAYNWY